jgi:tetratricopeptide (TPR) repeat protein
MVRARILEDGSRASGGGHPRLRPGDRSQGGLRGGLRQPRVRPPAPGRTDRPEPYFCRGNARAALGDASGALADYERALELRPGFTQAIHNRGTVRLEAGDAVRALADFDRAIELNGDYADARVNRAALRRERGDAAGAEADIDRAPRIEPEAAGVAAGARRLETTDPDGTRAVEGAPALSDA